MRRTLSSLFLTLTLGSFAQAQNPVYDTQTAYLNPLRGLPADCRACADFYRVVRPLFPLINHIVIGADVRTICGTEVKAQPFVYGASKGADDLEFFREDLWKHGHHLQPLGSACNENATRALDQAVLVSQRWQRNIENQFSFVAQMVMTPVLGRICNNAAEDVRLAIESELTKTNSHQE